MTLLEARQRLEQTLKDAGIESAKAEATWLLEHLFFVTSKPTEHSVKSQQGFRAGNSINTKSTNDSTGVSSSNFSPLQRVNAEITAEQFEVLNQWLERRLKREPLQHILGVAPFYGLELTVSADVLIPRPETELLAELVLKAVKHVPQPKILEVGTGSGAIALAIKHERPDAFVISTKALAVAKHNAEKYNLAVSFLESDLLHHPAVQNFARTSQVLVANLPYLPASDKARVSPEVLHDPDLALYAGNDGLELFRRLEQQAFDVVQPDALCFFELDPRNVETAYQLCQGWQERAVLEDLVRRKRFLKLVR
jgi:release factor glutamine methyltransferase